MENVRRNFKGRQDPVYRLYRLAKTRQGRGSVIRDMQRFNMDSRKYRGVIHPVSLEPCFFANSRTALIVIHLGSYLSVQTFGHLALSSQNKKRPLSDYSESGPFKNPKSSIWAGFGQAILPKFPNDFWCRRRDSNPHERSSPPPQDGVSTRFHHFGNSFEPKRTLRCVAAKNRLTFNTCSYTVLLIPCHLISFPAELAPAGPGRWGFPFPLAGGGPAWESSLPVPP